MIVNGIKYLLPVIQILDELAHGDETNQMIEELPSNNMLEPGQYTNTYMK